MIKKILNNYYLYIILLIILTISIYIGIKNNNIDQSILINNEYKGIIKDYSFDGNKINLIVISNVNLKVNYYSSSLDELNYLKDNIKYGSSIILNGNITIPLNNTIPNTFNYRKYLLSTKINYILNSNYLELNNDNISLFYKLKNYLRKHIDKYNNSDYLLTLIMGDKSLFDQSIDEAYRVNGVTHLFAISGSHISLFSIIIIFILKKFKLSEKTRFIIVTIFLIFYAFITNFSPSILRAVLFYILLSLNKILDLKVDKVKLLLLTIIILLFLNNYLIYDLGFKYAAVTSMGLIIASNHLKSKNYFIGLLKVSFMALLFSMPITLINFYEINILSVIYNIIFVPIITFLLYPLSLIVLILPMFIRLYNLIINITEYLSLLCLNFKITLTIPKIQFILIIIYYIFLILYLKKKQYFIYFALITIIIIPKFNYLFQNKYEVYILDVGQGDSILIRSPYNKENFLIDTGGKTTYKVEDWKKSNKEYNLSDNTILFMKSLGIKHLDTIITTHGDTDHLGEAVNIINNFNVKSVVFNKDEYNKNELEIIKTKVKVIEYYYSSNINITYYDTKLENNENDNSLIIKININNHNFLLMGDASQKKEDEILNKYNLDNIYYLKLGHHGSKTSSNESFLKEINPEIAIISSGRNNRFNHPSKEVIDTLNKLKINYLNTQDCGTIDIKITNNVKFKCNKP